MPPGVTPWIVLNNGVRMPQLGLGTSPLRDEEAAASVAAALEAGYRLIDTAVKYGNEKGVGRGIRDSGVPRDDIFITTKLDGPYQGGGRAVAALDGSLARLGVDYVDLLLIHWPLPWRDLYVDTWRTFIELAESGTARAIGVSNFKPGHLDRLRGEASVTPAVNQIMLHPGATRNELRIYHAEHGIATQSYSPLGSGTSELLRHPTINEVARRHGKSPAQVVLRWHLDLGVAPIPRSRDRRHIVENLDVVDFGLTGEEIASISALDQGEGAAPDSDVVGH